MCDEKAVAWSIEINGRRWNAISASQAKAEADIAWLKEQLHKSGTQRAPADGEQKEEVT